MYRYNLNELKGKKMMVQMISDNMLCDLTRLESNFGACLFSSKHLQQQIDAKYIFCACLMFTRDKGLSKPIHSAVAY